MLRQRDATSATGSSRTRSLVEVTTESLRRRHLARIAQLVVEGNGHSVVSLCGHGCVDQKRLDHLRRRRVDIATLDPCSQCLRVARVRGLA